MTRSSSRPRRPDRSAIDGSYPPAGTGHESSASIVRMQRGLGRPHYLANVGGGDGGAAIRGPRPERAMIGVLRADGPLPDTTRRAIIDRLAKRLPRAA